ncbi:MAG: Gfo/Idh/MocA family oxidoreductase [Verrucomicrobia bacterium]|nr:Gfo/Idh/MocA family oxidoreductase [Verrucomicrobiota bacterium]
MMPVASTPPRRVLVVGLGRVALGYDLGTRPEDQCFTHARAFARHPNFQLVGGVDPDADSRRRWTDHTEQPAFAAIPSALAATRPDVVVIATPTATHRATVELVLAHGTLRALVCEKPLAYTLADAEAMVAACARAGCALYVNYIRRSDPTVAELRRRLRENKILTPLNGVVWYSKGLYNSASHFINLLQDLLGETAEVSHVQPGIPDADGDPDPDFQLRFASGRITFFSVSADDYFHNTMEWISPSGRLRYEDGGRSCFWEQRQAPAQPGAYARLASPPAPLPGAFAHAQANFTQALALHLNGHPAHVSTGLDALATMRVLTRIQAWCDPSSLQIHSVDDRTIFS